MKAPFEKFYREKLEKMFLEKKNILDIGGGLRVSKQRGNLYSENNKWLLPYLKKVEYKIMDLVDTYHPDVIGDIHDMPFDNNTLEAIICFSILEHIENPILAAKELYRVLNSGGYCFIYVPFLYYYHAERGYYGDYWRFTEEALRFMFKDFSTFEIHKARGAIETWVRISPLGRVTILIQFGRIFDKLFKKQDSKQTSGFYVFLIK